WQGFRDIPQVYDAELSGNDDPRSRHGRRDNNRLEPARRVNAGPGCAFLSLLRGTVGALWRQAHRRDGTFRTLAFGHGSGSELLSSASGRIRAWQTDLAHGDRRRSLWWKPIGRDLPGHLSLSRPTRAIGQGRCSGRDAQYARWKRLRPAR